MLDRLARLIHRRRRRFLWGSLVVVLVAGFFGGPVFGLLDSGDDFDDPQAEAVLASRDVERATGASASPDMVALVRLGAPADSARAQDKLARVATAFRDRGIASVGRYERGGDRALVSKDGRSSYVVATFRSDSQGALDRIQARLGSIPGVTVGGGDLAQRRWATRSRRTSRAPSCSRSRCSSCSRCGSSAALVAALLPLLVGGVSIVLTFLALRLVNGAIDISVFALNLVTGLGLGLAIDYSLFIVSRYREELAARARRRARRCAATLATAGRTVLFSLADGGGRARVAARLPAALPLLDGPRRGARARWSRRSSRSCCCRRCSRCSARASTRSPRPGCSARAAPRRAGEAGFWYRLSRS